MKQLYLTVNETNDFEIVGEAIQSSVVVAKESEESEEKEETIIIHQNQTQLNF